jgi:hypothetical protein
MVSLQVKGSGVICCWLVSVFFVFLGNHVLSFQFELSRKPNYNNNNNRSRIKNFNSVLNMAGGMGMGGATVKSKKKKGKKGNNSKNKNVSPFDVSAALIKSEKLYEELSSNLAKEMNSVDENQNSDTITTEYMICARINPSLSPIPGSASISDWVPIAQLCLLRPLTDPFYTGDSSTSFMGDERVRMAVSYLCREINFSGSLGAPVLKSIPRNMIQYSTEPFDSFYRYVYEDVIEGKNENQKKGSSETAMTKSRAREVLKIDPDCSDAAIIKKAYRSLAFDLHPDRFVNVDRSDEARSAASDELASVKQAYETLNSGLRDATSNKSWYESLGGKSRTEFFGPINLVSVNDAKHQLTSEYKCAVASVDPDIVMSFIARNQAAARTLQLQ